MGTRSHPNDSGEVNTKYIDELCSETSVEDVVKAMLTENTGRSILDSGSAYGRHFEENQKTPPWEKPRTIVNDDYVIRNVYHHLERTLRRDDECTRLERHLYDLGASDEFKRDAWLTVMREFADRMHSSGERDRGPQSVNTYNSEFGSLTQCIQFVGFEYGGDSYVALQVHGGCDIRGGYTKPRVFNAHWTEVMTGEFSFYCPDCQWSETESVIGYDTLNDMTHPHSNELECPECEGRDVYV